MQCPRFPFGAKGASAGAEYQGIRQRFPYRCNKTKTSRTEVTVEPKTASPPEPLAGEDRFCRDKLTSCSPTNLAVVGSLPAQYLGRGPGPL